MSNARAGVTSVLLFLLAGAGTTAQPLQLPSQAGEREVLDVVTQHDEGVDQDDRVRDYFRRNGDLGVIDPVRKRALVRAEYERWSAERRGPRSLAIAGTAWVNVGPTNFAGRIRALSRHPTTTGTLYAGSAGGGLWRTTDFGANWVPLTEGVPDLAIGSLAVAASAPNTIYVGTGEGSIPGIGLMKSIDGGSNWTFPEVAPFPGPYFALSVNPINANDVLLGTTQNGGQRSTDGGQHFTAWSVVGTAGTVVRDIVRDPTNSNIVYATTTGGASSTVLKSVDAGSNWTVFANGLPVTANEIKLAISSDGTTKYAAFDLSSLATVYKSVSGGAWAATAAVVPSNLYFGQPNYNNTIVVAPGTTDTVIVCGGVCSKTTSGGNLWAALSMTGGSHVDFHDLEFDSAANAAGGTLYFATDGGIYSSTDKGDNTVARNTGLVTAQFYKVALDRSNPNRVLGGLQDNGTWRRNAAVTTWDFLVSSDGQGCLLSSDNPSLGWVSNQAYGRGNYLWRTKDMGGPSSPGPSVPLFTIIAPIFPTPSEQLPFATELVNDPRRDTTLYTNTNRLWRSTTGGDTWIPLPTTTTDGSTWSTNILTAIAVAASDPKTIMVAKYADVFRSADGGTTWTRRNTGLPGYWVNGLAIDDADANTAYVALATSNGSSVYHTANGGANWTQRSTGLPQFAAEVIRIDPTDPTTLYCGTAAGVYRSTDRGLSWTPFGTGLPRVAVYDLRISNDGSLLRAGTHGRGVWELQIPASTNNPPAAVISSPAASTVAKGTLLTFNGTISDADGGVVTGNWLFPDTWDAASIAAAGATSVAHTFNTAGIYPVSLSARDALGATASASVNITVTEAGETCAAPIAIPAGPFPLTVSVSTEAYTTEADGTDPVACNGSTPFYTAWFSFVPPSTGSYELSTCGSSYQTVLAAFTGSCGALTGIAGGCATASDPNGTSGCPNGGSIITVSLTAGVPVRVMAGGRYYSTSHGLLSLTVKPSPSTAPTVTRIAASAGPSTGGAPVTLYGSNFAIGMSVTFGGTAATGVSVLTSNIATAVTPPRAAGAVDVVATNPDIQSGRLVNGYTYATCSISLSSSSASLSSSGGAASASVTATPGCGWTAMSNDSWVQTSSYGIGDGKLSLFVMANTTTTARAGTITLGGQTFTVNQNGVSPSNLVATATSSTAVSVTWSATSVDHFELWRNSGAGFALLTSPSTNGYTDTVSANASYVYKVKAVDAGGNASAFSNADVATTMFFTDDPLGRFTIVKAAHITELRLAVNAIRAAAGLGAASVTDGSLTGVVIKAVHITELRTALDLARSNLGLPAVPYTSVAVGTPVRTAPVVELRDGVK